MNSEHDVFDYLAGGGEEPIFRYADQLFQIRRNDQDVALLTFLDPSDITRQMPIPDKFSLHSNARKLSPRYDYFILLCMNDYQLKYEGEVIWKLKHKREHRIVLANNQVRPMRQTAGVVERVGSRNKRTAEDLEVARPVKRAKIVY